jgi:hypothetical protein
MSNVISADGTRIPFDLSGEGPAVILVGGAFQHRAIDPPTAVLAAAGRTLQRPWSPWSAAAPRCSATPPAAARPRRRRGGPRDREGRGLWAGADRRRQPPAAAERLRPPPRSAGRSRSARREAVGPRWMSRCWSSTARPANRTSPGRRGIGGEARRGRRRTLAGRCGSPSAFPSALPRGPRRRPRRTGPRWDPQVRERARCSPS